jgi:hypothetical protein
MRGGLARVRELSPCERTKHERALARERATYKRGLCMREGLARERATHVHEGLARERATHDRERQAPAVVTSSISVCGLENLTRSVNVSHPEKVEPPMSLNLTPEAYSMSTVVDLVLERVILSVDDACVGMFQVMAVALSATVSFTPRSAVALDEPKPAVMVVLDPACCGFSLDPAGRTVAVSDEVMVDPDVTVWVVPSVSVATTTADAW